MESLNLCVSRKFGKIVQVETNIFRTWIQALTLSLQIRLLLIQEHVFDIKKKSNISRILLLFSFSVS